MHYTVCNLDATINLFTKNTTENRVSSHLVITEKESENNILKGGHGIMVCPFDKEAWHAGVSSFGGYSKLN